MNFCDRCLPIRTQLYTINIDINFEKDFYMIAFIKNNSYLIFRLMLNQFGMTVFGLMTSMAAAAVDNALAGGGKVGRTCMIWVSVFAVLFHIYINYMALKEEGQKDKIRLDAGRAEYTPLRGLYIALVASVINLLLGLIIVVADLIPLDAAIALSGSCKILSSILQATFWGMMLGLSGVATIAELPSFWFIIIPLPTIICGWISYRNGLHDVSLLRAIKKLFTPVSSDNK